jgi:hypothetical protein
MGKRFVSVLITLCFVISGAPAQADLTNPPKILDVQIDASRDYKSGDTVAIDVLYLGGDPGLQTAEIFFRRGSLSNLEDDITRCFLLDSWNASATSFENSNYGNIRPGVIRILASVTSNCYPGLNRFYAYVALADKTGLRTNLTRFPFVISIIDGKVIEAGTAVIESKNSGFNLDGFVRENSPGIISSSLLLPQRTPEGFLIIWNNAGLDNCAIKRSFPREVSNQLVFLKVGICKIVGSFELDRSEYRNLSLMVDIPVKQMSEAGTASAPITETKKRQVIGILPLVRGEIAVTTKTLPVVVASDSGLPVSAYSYTRRICDFENGSVQIRNLGTCAIAFDQTGNSEYESAARVILEFKIVPQTLRSFSVKCIKGKVTKKIVGVAPKCPKGYKKAA